MISGGSIDGDSNRARKTMSRRDCMEVEGVRRSEVVISFGPEDLKCVNLPHNDALVIQARVANYDIMRVFVDLGSFVNFIFKEVLVQMDLHGYHLETVDTTLFDFAGHVVHPEGEIVLPLSLGTRELKKTVMTTFTVVDAPGKPDRRSPGRLVFFSEVLCRSGPGGPEESKKGRKESSELWGDGEGSGEGRGAVCGRGRAGEVKIGPDKEIRVVRHLDLSTRQEFIGISPLIAEHHLNILPGSQPIKQKKRHFGPEKDKVIDVQVKDLLKSGHIWEKQFPTWLSNVVLVPKSTGKWIMCLDFRDLSKACPKAHYPLPIIDQLVDSTYGYELLSFMDAYQGLKNAGATYQRLMNKVFEKQLGRNVEVYVDDILGKSKEGFVVTDRGIEVNQEKFKYVLDMPSPRFVREVQKLTGRIASLSDSYLGQRIRVIHFFRYSEVENIALALVMTVPETASLFSVASNYCADQ
ncbi:uncharacterized protein LOC142537548 [Primulina tabacum]|uniref:uncharacterized protein LOC142537548 n=1 Tax=Primulina tabacum TaxID=48773 RepID=UPI003F5A5F33